MSQIPLRFLDLIPRDYFHQRDINVINSKSRGYDDLIGIKGCIISRGFDRRHGFVKGKRVFWQILTNLASIHSYHFILKDTFTFPFNLFCLHDTLTCLGAPVVHGNNCVKSLDGPICNKKMLWWFDDGVSVRWYCMNGLDHINHLVLVLQIILY